MTVGVGFQGRDFVLLCADSEISRGDWKSQECKIHILSGRFSKCHCACAYAGDVDYMKQVLPSLERVCRANPTKIVSRLKREWDSIYKKSMKRCNRGVENPLIQMLFAIDSGAGPKLYLGNRDIFRAEQKYEIIGIGGDVARSVVELAYRDLPALTRPEALLLAASGIKQAKDYTQGCGKKIQCLVLDKIGAFFGGPYVDELNKFEEYFQFFRERTSRLLLALANVEEDDPTFEEELRRFNKELKEFHEEEVKKESILRDEASRPES